MHRAVDTTKSNHAWLFYAFVGVLMLAPLLWGSYLPKHWWYTAVGLQVLSVSCIVLWMTNQLKLTSSLNSARWQILTLTILATYVGYQSSMPGFSISPHDTLEHWVKTICLLEAFCLTLLLVDSEQRLKFLVLALVFSGTFQAVYGTLMTVSGVEHIWNEPKFVFKGVATGTFVGRNHLAGYLEMTLAMGIGLLVASLEQNRPNTWRQWARQWTETLLGEKARIRICLALMVIGLILTQSRMGNTAFFAAMGISGVLGLVIFRKSSKSVVLLFGSLLIIDIFLLGTFFGVDKVQERLAKTNMQEEQRATVNLSTAQNVPEGLVAGAGLGTWYAQVMAYRKRTITTNFQHTHNDFLQFTSELGLPATLLLGALWLNGIIKSFRTQIQRKRRLYRGVAFGCGLALISILIHSAVDFNLQIFANSLTFIVILALTTVSSSTKKPEGNFTK